MSSNLHQIGHLELLPQLVSRITVPTAVAQALAEGRRRGLDLPIPEALPWVDLCAPTSERVVRLVSDLGPGEAGVLLLRCAAWGAARDLTGMVGGSRAGLDVVRK